MVWMIRMPDNSDLLYAGVGDLELGAMEAMR